MKSVKTWIDVRASFLDLEKGFGVSESSWQLPSSPSFSSWLELGGQLARKMLCFWKPILVRSAGSASRPFSKVASLCRKGPQEPVARMRMGSRQYLWVLDHLVAARRQSKIIKITVNHFKEICDHFKEMRVVVPVLRGCHIQHRVASAMVLELS